MDAVKSTSLEKIIKVTLIVLLGTALLTLSAKIKIPFYPVPMTMQTFVVLFLGVAFGYKIGLASVILYLLEGIIGFLFIILRGSSRNILKCSDTKGNKLTKVFLL